MIAPVTKRGALSRHNFTLAALIVAILAFLIAAASYANGSPKAVGKQIDDVLRRAVEQHKVPGVVAMVGTTKGIVYQGAAGKRDVHANIPMTKDSIFRIASMTKPIISVAVMQLVELGLVKLDEPAGTYLPELSRVQVLESFDPKTGHAKLRPPKNPVTVRYLLSHTSGFAYEFFNRRLHDYAASGAVPSLFQGGDGYLAAPLMFDPGERWEYGISTDWLGRLVEVVSKQSLEDYCREHIFEPLGMSDTSFNVPLDKQSRLVTVHQRKDDGTLAEVPPQSMKPVKFFSGGGGLYSTAGDYMKFARMLLGEGTLGQTRILRPETVKLMGQNQIGNLTVGHLGSVVPQLVRDTVAAMGALDKFGLGLAMNTKPFQGGRSAGSLAWSGIYNTHFWVDPSRQTCVVLMMQILPFMDDSPKEVLEEFERALYTPSTESGHR